VWGEERHVCARLAGWTVQLSEALLCGLVMAPHGCMCDVTHPGEEHPAGIDACCVTATLHVPLQLGKCQCDPQEDGMRARAAAAVTT
jgi:hypothetical protein